MPEDRKTNQGSRKQSGQSGSKQAPGRRDDDDQGARGGQQGNKGTDQGTGQKGGKQSNR